MPPPPRPKKKPHPHPIPEDPNIIIALSLRQLNDLETSVRAEADDAVEREERLAEMLAQAQELREQALERYVDGVAVIDDRRRRLRQLQGLSDEEISRARTGIS